MSFQRRDLEVDPGGEDADLGRERPDLGGVIKSQILFVETPDLHHKSPDFDEL